MRSFSKVSLIAAALMASTAMVQAADIISAPVDDFVPAPEVVTHSSVGGWYIRGDIGYAYQDYDADTQFLQGGSLVGVLDNSEIDETFTLKGGIGYQVNDHFRVDATVSYYNSADTVGFSRNNASPGAPAPVTCLNSVAGVGECLFTDTQEVESTILMANAYADLGTYNGFTPYVGAGIGGAHVSYSSLVNSQTCAVAAPVDPLSCVDFQDTHPGEDQWRFAWSLHAGGSYDINCKLKVDAGYTFTRIEGGKAFGFPSGSGIAGTQGFDNGIDIHEGRVGLRYMLNDSGCDVPVEQPKIVYK